LSLAATAEIERLARLLRCRAQDVEFLGRFPAAELRALRLAVFDRIYADHEATFARIASASRLLPMRVTAPLAERMLPARVAAGVVASLPADQAAAMSGRMSVGYVADVAAYLSPTLGSDVLTRLSNEVICRVAAVLGERGDHNTMAEIVGALTEDQVVAVVGDIDDPETLVQVALRVTDPGSLQRLADLLPEGKLQEMVAHARRRTALWPELAGLLGRLPATQRKRLLGGTRAG
jgi:hypothetical protein